MGWWLGSAVALFLLIRLVVWAGYRYGDRKSPLPTATPAVEDPDPIGVLCAVPLVHELPSPAPTRFRWARVAGKDAIAALPELDRLGAQHGWCAVIVGDSKSLPQFDDVPPEDPEEILSAASKIDVEAWIKRRLGEMLDGDQIDSALGKPISERQASTLLPQPYAVLRRGVFESFHAWVYIALAPVRHAWQAPAYLQNGGWNDVPEPAEQVAVLHHWDRLYDARLRTFSHDTMELDVGRRPKDRDASLTLAREQWAFCSDIVDQGAGALMPLACALQVSPNWHFWWD